MDHLSVRVKFEVRSLSVPGMIAIEVLGGVATPTQNFNEPPIYGKGAYGVGNVTFRKSVGEFL